MQKGPNVVESGNSILRMAPDEKSRLEDAIVSDLRTEFAKLYSEVTNDDLQTAKFGGSEPQRNPRLARIPDFFNKISCKVMDDILNASSQEEQQAIHDFYISIMAKCINQGNYPAAQAMAAAFDNSAISRLKYLTENSQNKSTKLEILGYFNDRDPTQNKPGLFDPNKNFANLRAHMAERNDIIYPLNILSRDLTFAKEGNEGDEKREQREAETNRIINNFRNKSTVISPNQGMATSIVQQINKTSGNPDDGQYYAKSTTVMPLRETSDAYFRNQKFEMNVEQQLKAIVDKRLGKLPAAKSAAERNAKLRKSDINDAINFTAKGSKINKAEKKQCQTRLQTMSYAEFEAQQQAKLAAGTMPKYIETIAKAPQAPIPLSSVLETLEQRRKARQENAADSSAPQATQVQAVKPSQPKGPSPRAIAKQDAISAAAQAAAESAGKNLSVSSPASDPYAAKREQRAEILAQLSQPQAVASPNLTKNSSDPFTRVSNDYENMVNRIVSSAKVEHHLSDAQAAQITKNLMAQREDVFKTVKNEMSVFDRPSAPYHKARGSSDSSSSNASLNDFGAQMQREKEMRSTLEREISGRTEKSSLQTAPVAQQNQVAKSQVPHEPVNSAPPLLLSVINKSDHERKPRRYSPGGVEETKVVHEAEAPSVAKPKKR